MADPSSASGKTISAVRIATGLIFSLFGEYKLASPAFAHTGFQQSLQSYIDHEAVSFYRPFLVHIVSPRAVFFGYSVGVIELAVAASLILGLWVRPMSLVGALFLLNITLSSWWAPGHGAPFWRYFGASLDTIPLIFLFLIFFATDAGRTWGVDGALHLRR